MKGAWQIGLLAIFLLLAEGTLVPLVGFPELAWPIPSVLFWIMLPFSWGNRLGLLLSIGFGLSLDLLYPPIGLHTFCGLWVWGLRKAWLRMLNPNLPPEWEASFTPTIFQPGEFFIYAFPLTLWHHLWYFGLGRWTLSSSILLLSTLSAAYTFLWEWVIFELLLRKRHA